MLKPKFYYRWWFIAIFLIFFFPIGFLLLILKCRDLSSSNESLNQQCINFRTANDNLYEKVAEYESTWESRVAEAEKKATDTINTAQELANEITAKAKQFEQSARDRERDAKRLQADAAKHEFKASEAIEGATLKAQAIVESAQLKVSDLKNTIQALKNTVNGYGDDYLLPANTLLDDLAEHFGFTDASENLKKAKANTKLLMKTSKAATCEYVEEVRSKTAINFVIDAFNGKVDSILTKLKGGDNFGKCKQAIIDACALVNHGGVAFRNAKITDEFLNSRLEELRWGAVLLELKKKEQEEQREIRERMREEARARAEYEKAKAEAEKEEARIRASQAKLEQALLHATESQRQKYEHQLEELKEKLLIAEEQSKRAQSMAELTRAGHVYIISNIGSFGDRVFKIGMTRRLQPEDRVAELSSASVPFPFDIHAMIYSEDAPSLENKLHEVFENRRVNKINYRKEFFRVSLDEISNEVENLGFKTSFTILAKAEEYRETMNLEKKSANQFI